MKNKEFWIEKFEQFLKDNNCYEEFEKNVLELNHIGFAKEILYKLANPIYFLKGAFKWFYSKQKYDFWDELDGKWIKLCEQEGNILGYTLTWNDEPINISNL